MMKNLLFAMALLSLALAGGCAKGGNGVVTVPITIDVAITSPSNVAPSFIYPTQSVTLTATPSSGPDLPVTWSLSGTACTGSGNPCGTLTPVTPATTPPTAAYVAPTSAVSGVTVTATSTTSSSITGTLGITIVDITTDVAPVTLSVGSGLTQQFTAVAVPDDAPQTFYWTCQANGVQCASGNFSPAPNVSSPGVASYTYGPQDSCAGNCLQISAASTLDPNFCSNNPKSCTVATASLVASRLSVSSTYAFQFSGYDSSQQPVMVVGNFTTGKTGGISSGVEEVLTASGPSGQNPIAITGGSYTTTPFDANNSNNAGTLALTLTLPKGVSYPNQYQVVLDGAGDMRMIESDGLGTGSGIAQKWTSANQPNLFTGNQTFAFGFTGVDSSGNRVGFAGVLPMNGSGGIVSGQMDVNDNGNDTNICGASPCGVVGTYSADQNISGLWHMILTSGSLNMNFDFFISSGTTSKTNPLTFYAISTSSFDNTHPEVSGTMVLQDSTQTYNNAAFKGTSVSALTGTALSGVNTNVSLTLGTTDGKGNFSGQFDQNNAGTILSGAQFPPSGSNSYTYAASGTNGRYTFNLLGNPTAKPVQAPLPFVLYASGQNRGFLLDPSSSSVMTGTMNPQGQGSGTFANSVLPGTYAAATTGSGSSAVTPIAANLLLTYPGIAAPGASPIPNPTVVSGTQYPPYLPPLQAVTGTYTLSLPGTGTITLTAPPPPSPENYVIYVLDTAGCSGQGLLCTIKDFLMMDEDKTNANASIIFAQQ